MTGYSHSLWVTSIAYWRSLSTCFQWFRRYLVGFPVRRVQSYIHVVLNSYVFGDTDNLRRCNRESLKTLPFCYKRLIFVIQVENVFLIALWVPKWYSIHLHLSHLRSLDWAIIPIVICDLLARFGTVDIHVNPGWGFSKHLSHTPKKEYGMKVSKPRSYNLIKW